ncbi:hypothetical protein NECID01_1499, partial [Nematocida sp. AWRm77]
DTPTHACSSSDAKRLHEEVGKEDGEQKAEKRQKVNTTATSTATETNTALMDETEACLTIEEFGRYFGKDTKISGYMPRSMLEFAKDLGRRGLASVHSSKIVEVCMASEEWRGHTVFWRMLLFFVDTMSLEVVHLDRLEDKKTIVLRNRTRNKPLSECSRQHIYKTIDRCRGAERMEMQCSLNILESRGTADVLGVLKWLLYHVNIRCVGITCDLTEVGMSSAVLRRQVEALSKERRGTRVCIDSLTLRFILAQYKDAAVVVKECPWVTVLKIHFIGNDLTQADDSIRLLKALLLHCPALEQLSVFGVRVGVEHIRKIAAMLPQLVLLEVELLSLDTLVLSQKEEEEFRLVFSGLKTLKLPNMYNYNCSCSGIEKFVCLFPSLKFVQISAKNVTTPLIDALSSLRFLRSLETVNGLVPIETAEYLLERLPSLECLSVGVNKLDNKLVHVLSGCTGIQTLILRGIYTPGFLASLLQPSPLMSTLKVLTLWRNCSFYRKDKFSAEDLSSKDTAMENFGCTIEIIY